MGNLDDWKTVIGEAFRKGVGQGEVIDGDGTKTNFTVKSFVSGAYINATLWANSHGHVEVRQGDTVIINGKYTTPPKKDGDGTWKNISVGRIAVITLDPGVRDDAPSEGSSGDDDPDVL